MTASVAPISLPKPGVNKWAVAIAVAIGAMLEIIDTSIVNVALTEIQASLGATLTQVSWVVSSYGIANVIILPLAAWLGHRFGKKRYFLFSLVGFTAASILCGVSASLPMLVVARVLQGLTGGGLLAKAQSILFETFPREEQAKAQAFFGAIVIAGPAIGPTLGGYIVTNIGWRWIFFINLPVGILAVFLVIAALPADEARAKVQLPVDWLGIALLAIGVGSLESFLEQGNEEDWFSSKLIVALAIASVTAISLFVVRMVGAKEPVVDLSVLRYRLLWAGSIISVVVGMALYGALFAVPIFAGTLLHFTSQEVGVMLLPGAIAAAILMPVAAKVSKMVEPRIQLSIGALILVSALMLLTRLSPSTGGGDFFWPLVIRSMGTVMMFIPLQLAAIGPIPKKDIPAATGLFNLTRQLGGAMGVALLTMLLEKREAFHRAVLVEHASSSSQLTLDRVNLYTQAMLAKGYPLVEAKARALASLDGLVNQQAAVLSFADTFWATAVLVLATLPLVLLLGRPPKGVAVSSGH